MKLFLLLFFMNMNAIVILVHGTFASDQEWYRPGHPFFDDLEAEAFRMNQFLIPFAWTGGILDYNRNQASESLVKVIESYPKQEKVIAIGHSHGGNIINLASQKLNPSYSIDKVYLLGTPIDIKNYKPNMDRIKELYNLYSQGDLIQQVFGIYRRLVPLEKAVNLKIEIENRGIQNNPLHYQLHHSMLAKTILSIPECFNNFSSDNNGIIHFDKQGTPNFKIDELTTEEREEKEAIPPMKLVTGITFLIDSLSKLFI